MTFFGVLQKRFLNISVCIAVAAAISGCATIRAGSHHDEAASFDGYQTFSWIADDPMIAGEVSGGMPVSALTKKKIVDAIADELTRKGYAYSPERSTADFVVSYTIGTRQLIEAASYPAPYRGQWGWHLYGRYYYDKEVIHRTYTEGTLGVDIFDGQSGQPVWHGWASKTVSAEDRRNPSASITKGVSALFAEFPPG